MDRDLRINPKVKSTEKGGESGPRGIGRSHQDQRKAVKGDAEKRSR